MESEAGGGMAAEVQPLGTHVSFDFLSRDKAAAQECVNNLKSVLLLPPAERGGDSPKLWRSIGSSKVDVAFPNGTCISVKIGPVKLLKGID